MNAGQAGGITSIIFPILLFVVLIAFMIIPQRRRDKKTRAMLDSLKSGDRVKTIGGIHGTVVKTNPDTVTVAVGPDKVKLVFSRGAIATVETDDEDEKESKSSKDKEIKELEESDETDEETTEDEKK